jgi:chromosome segregation ATPase
MELGAREMLTFATVLCGLAGTWAVIKSTVARIQEDLKGINEEIASLNVRLDATESGDAVMKHQLGVLGNMLSPAQMDSRSRELEALQHRVNSLRRDTDELKHIHNNRHPDTGVRNV